MFIKNRVQEIDAMKQTDQQNIVIKDSEDLKNLLIQVNLRNGNTLVVSNFSAWNNLAYILEGLGATAQQCMREGKSMLEVKEAISRYLDQVIRTYVTDWKFPKTYQ